MQLHVLLPSQRGDESACNYVGSHLVGCWLLLVVSLQAEAMLSGALASVMSARPHLDLLAVHLKQSAGAEAGAEAHAGLQRVLRASRALEREVQQMSAQAGLLPPSSPR